MEQSERERFREIARTLASYGFGHVYRVYLRSDDPQYDAAQFRLAFEELGPSFIKIGQILSTRPDLLPQPYIEELEKLQDHTPEIDFEVVQEIIEGSMGQPLHEVFRWIDAKALASASVAQVHRAELLDGTPVIVKVQRPEIEENLLMDIELFYKLMMRAPDTIKDMVGDLEEAYLEIRRSVELELDFRNEARALIRYRENSEDVAVATAPKPYIEYTNKVVLVEEYVEGITGLDPEALEAAGYDLQDVGEKILYAFLIQVFRDEFFHADPHPGNIIIKDRKIYFIDWGIYGELSTVNRKYLQEVLKAIIFRDIDKIVDLILSMGLTSGPVDAGDLYTDVEYLFDTYAERPLKQIDMDLVFSDLMRVIRRHQISLPHDFISLVRALLLIEGVVSDLSPEVNILSAGQAYIRQDDISNWLDIPSKRRLLVNTLTKARKLSAAPDHALKLLDNMANDRMTINLKLKDPNNRWKGLNKMVNRVIFALIISALILASSVIVVLANNVWLEAIGFIAFLVAAVMGLWLLISIIKSGTL